MDQPSMHPQHAVDARFALHEEPSSQESGNSVDTECSSPPRMTKDIQDTKLTPIKFTLSGVKRKTTDDLELIYATSYTTIHVHVPFEKGETQFVLHRRRDTLAQIALEEHLRVTAFCMWTNSLLSFRFNPAGDWTLT
jgi:hypothetical protein